MSEPLPGYDDWRLREPSYLDGTVWCSSCEAQVEPVDGLCPVCDKQLREEES